MRNGGDPVQFLRRIAYINETYINNTLGQNQIIPESKIFLIFIFYINQKNMGDYL